MSRHRSSRAAARVAAASAAVAIILSAGSPAQAAIPPPPFPEYYGISPATRLEPRELEQMSRAGAGTIRWPFHWPSIEPDPPEAPGPLPIQPGGDRLRWGPTDELVRGAAANGIRILPFVYGSPDWIAQDQMRPPLDGERARAEWQDFLRDLVGRYGPAGEFWSQNPRLLKVPITAWQIWNEQNSSVFWKPAPSAAEYAELLRLSDAAIGSVDPGAAVVLGGLFGTPLQGVASWTYLEGLYGVPGIAEAFDAYALHPYARNLAGIKAQIGLARNVVRDAGDRKLPLLISEIGWPTEGPPNYNLVKAPEAQKRMLAKAFRLFLAERRRWNLHRVIWYTWRDNEVRPDCSVCSFSGLFNRQLEPKPAWAKFAQFAGGRP